MRTLTFAVLVGTATSAHADRGNGENVLVGPVLGIRLGGHAGHRMIFGVEGGGGIGPERINLGFERRDHLGFGYIELDPWLIIGASLGVGVDTDGDAHPVLGVWEGAPLVGAAFTACGDTSVHFGASIAVGYRYSGVHELYLTAKAGIGEPSNIGCN